MFVHEPRLDLVDGLFDKDAVFDVQQPVSVAFHVWVMCNHYTRCLCGLVDLKQQIHYSYSIEGVQVSGRFIEEKQFRLICERSRDGPEGIKRQRVNTTQSYDDIARLGTYTRCCSPPESSDG